MKGSATAEATQFGKDSAREIVNEQAPLQISPPKVCPACGAKEKKITDAGGYLMLPTPSSVIRFFICPVCLCVSANREALMNNRLLAKAIKEREEKRVITLS